MVAKVLVVSATPGFSELIEITLKDEQDYDAYSVASAEMALEYMQDARVDYCILDADVRDIPLGDFAEVLRANNPAVRLIVIPPENDRNHPDIRGLKFDETLTKPFYIPDLVRMLNRFDASENDGKHRMITQEANHLQLKSTKEQVPEWLLDVNRAAQHLMRLSLESSAHAALIVRGGKLWAYAGQLPQSAAQELAEHLSPTDTRPLDRQGDVARFAHLNSTDSDYMLYATGLAGDIFLALAFDAAMPFTKMRTQAAELARALSDIPSPIAQTANRQSAELNKVVDRDPLDTLPLPDEDVDIPILDLGDVPPPIPWRVRSGSKPVEENPLDAPEDDYRSDYSLGDFVPKLDPDSLPEALPPDVTPAYQKEKSEPNEWLPASVMDDSPILNHDATQAPPTTDRGHSGVTHVVVTDLPEPDAKTDLPKPTAPSPTVVSLSFACLLVPRLPHHHLIGDVADRLPGYLRQSSLAFGWRLGHMAIRPDYLLWLVEVPPSTSAGELMQTMRQQLSKLIFKDFAYLAGDNPSGDFWAPGYLIMSSHQPPPPQIVKEFITNTRHFQGL